MTEIASDIATFCIKEPYTQLGTDLLMVTRGSDMYSVEEQDFTDKRLRMNGTPIAAKYRIQKELQGMLDELMRTGKITPPKVEEPEPEPEPEPVAAPVAAKPVSSLAGIVKDDWKKSPAEMKALADKIAALRAQAETAPVAVAAPATRRLLTRKRRES